MLFLSDLLIIYSSFDLRREKRRGKKNSQFTEPFCTERRIVGQNGENHDREQLKQFTKIYAKVPHLLEEKLGKPCTCDEVCTPPLPRIKKTLP
jgi:hypothetical protein